MNINNDKKTLLLLGFGLVGSCLTETFLVNKDLGKIINKFNRYVIIDPERKNDQILNFFKDNINKDRKKGERKENNEPIEVHRLYEAVTKENVHDILYNWTTKGDLIIDLSYNISFEPLLKWCLETGVHYINTSMERWELENENELNNICNRLLHSTHNRAYEIQNEYLDSRKTTNNIENNINPLQSTLILTHGMNPGLITYFTFDGIINIAKSVLYNNGLYDIINNTIHPFSASKLQEIKIALDKKSVAELARLLGIKSIHCSERDTQMMIDNIPSTLLKDANLEGVNPKTQSNNIFFNTWSPYGFYSEGVDPIQLGWGNTEKPVPSKINGKDIQIVDCNTSPDNQLYINKRGVDMYLYSYVPIISKDCGSYSKLDAHMNDLSLNDRALTDLEYIQNHNMSDGHIIGMNISHSENDTLNRALTIKDQDGKVIYRPSNYYVYSPSEASWQSLYNVRKGGYEMLKYKMGLDNRYLKCGEDAVGALIIMQPDDLNISHPVSYWSGTILDVRQTRGFGYSFGAPTTVQVAVSLLSALRWLYNDNDKVGIIYPEMMPWQEIYGTAHPYLGTVYSDFVPFLSKSPNFVDNILYTF